MPAAPTTCDCACHWSDIADYRAAEQHEDAGFDVPQSVVAPSLTDAVAAALACSVCRNDHAVALLTVRPPKLPPGA